MTDAAQKAIPLAKPRSQWADVWVQFKSHKGALVGLFVFVSLVLFVSIGPM
ncbi:MAG: ABC transporter permease, partial [Pseudorhodobacter sp.]